jgi:carboxymethylenebutenolidase
MDESEGLRRYPLPRRGFMMSGLISGITLATTHAASAQVIHTGDDGLVAGEVRIPVEDGALPAYRARPAGAGRFPVVLVIEEIFGVHDYIKDVCRRLAHLGFLAVAPELYARLADLSTMTDAQQIVRDVISKAPDATVLSDLDAAATWTGGQQGDLSRLGVIGFCRGGRDAWLYAEHDPRLKAAVAFYGPVNTVDTPIQPRSPLDLAGQLRCPLLGLYGGRDTSIAQADVRAAQAKARAAGRAVEIVVFPDAPHGFHADYRPSYRKADAEDGWNRAIAWLHAHGVR